MLNEEIIQSINECVLCWLATANSQGEPNVSPKEMFVPYSENRLLIANIASPHSIANIEENAFVCVSFVEVFKQKGFKLKGKANLIQPSDVNFDECLQALHQLGGKDFPVQSIIEVVIQSAEPIIAPSYWMFPETTEGSQIEQSMKTYGVRSNRK